MQRLNQPTPVELTVQRNGSPVPVTVYAWPYARSVIVALRDCGDDENALHDFWSPAQLAAQIHGVAGVNDADGQPLPATPAVWTAALWDAVYGDWPELYIAAVGATRLATDEAKKKRFEPSSPGATGAAPEPAATASPPDAPAE